MGEDGESPRPELAWCPAIRQHLSGRRDMRGSMARARMTRWQPSHCHRPATAPSQRQEAGPSQGGSWLLCGPECPRDELAAARPLRPFAAPLVRAFCHSQESPVFPHMVPRYWNDMRGSIHSITPSICWVQKAPGRRKSTSCVPLGGSGPAAGAEGAVPGQGSEHPRSLLQPAGQGASLASAALSAGRAGMFAISYGRPGCRLQ